nr:helix-turn-helix domain-containing protein [Gemmobacter aestuarii]
MKPLLTYRTNGVARRDIGTRYHGGLAKGLSVIKTFTADRSRQSIVEVSAACDLDRATVRRSLLTLAHHG